MRSTMIASLGHPLRLGAETEPGSSSLLTDLYHLNMIEAYLAHNETKTATFELFLLKLAAQRGFLMPAGLEQALKFLEGLRFTADEIGWLKGLGVQATKAPRERQRQ